MEKHKIDRDLPIKLKNIEHVIERISNQYKLLDKIQIIIIIQRIFEIIRRSLVSGKIIQINKIMFSMKIKKYIRKLKNKNIEHIKIKISTPRKFNEQ